MSHIKPILTCIIVLLANTIQTFGQNSCAVENYEPRILITASLSRDSLVACQNSYFFVDYNVPVQPCDMAVDSNGNVYILDPGCNRIQVFDNNGVLVKYISIPNGFTFVMDTVNGMKTISNLKSSFSLRSDGGFNIYDEITKEMHVLNNEGKYVRKFPWENEMKGKYLTKELKILGTKYSEINFDYFYINKEKDKKTTLINAQLTNDSVYTVISKRKYVFKEKADDFSLEYIGLDRINNIYAVMENGKTHDVHVKKYNVKGDNIANILIYPLHTFKYFSHYKRIVDANGSLYELGLDTNKDLLRVLKWEKQ